MIPKNYDRPTEIEISRADLEKLPEYSLSIPTGVTPGKRWRCNLKARIGRPAAHDDAEWQIAEYVECDELPEDRIGISWTWAIDPETGTTHRGNLR